TRKFLHLSCPEGFFELMRLYGLILTDPDPGSNNVSIAALFEASNELLESRRLNVRLIGGESRVAASWCKQRSKGIFQARRSGSAHLGHSAIANRCNDEGR